MGDRDELHVSICEDSVHEIEGKLQKHEPTGTETSGWIALWRLLNSDKSALDLPNELARSGGAPFCVPICGDQKFGPRG